MMIVNDDSRVVNKLEASLSDDARVVIYDRHMFIVQATGFGDKLAIGNTIINSLVGPEMLDIRGMLSTVELLAKFSIAGHRKTYRRKIAFTVYLLM